MDREGYIVAFRMVVTRGKVTGYKNGPIHVADIARYTDVDLDYLSSLVGGVQLNTAPSGKMKVDALKLIIQFEAMTMVSYVHPWEYLDLITQAVQVGAPHMMS
jgi:hypothetical protein